jgi:hypothetical protein
MRCKAWEERIALLAGGDLAGAEAAEVQRHLAECAGCREAAAGYAWSLGLAKEAHEEPIAPAHYAAVRARVMAELEQGWRPFWRRPWAWGLAAAAVLILVFALPVGRTSRSRFRGKPPETAADGYRPATPTESDGRADLLGARQAGKEEEALAGAEGRSPAPHRPRRRIVAAAKQEGRRTQDTSGYPTQVRLGSPAPHREAVTIKLLTDDPNVIIYWIADAEGD